LSGAMKAMFRRRGAVTMAIGHVRRLEAARRFLVDILDPADATADAG
jgi:hypothetical protein